MCRPPTIDESGRDFRDTLIGSPSHRVALESRMPHVRALRFVLTAAAVALSAVSAAAQTAQTTRASLRGAAPGSCRLTIDVPALSAATPLEVLINKGRVLLDSAGPGARTF